MRSPLVFALWAAASSASAQAAYAPVPYTAHPYAQSAAAAPSAPASAVQADGGFAYSGAPAAPLPMGPAPSWTPQPSFGLARSPHAWALSNPYDGLFLPIDWSALKARHVGRTLAFTGEAPTSASGALAANAAIASVPVRYAVTGVTARPLATRGWGARSEIPAGAPVFAHIMAPRKGGVETTLWCAPRQEATKKGLEWVSICLRPSGSASRRTYDAMLPYEITEAMWRGTTEAVEVTPAALESLGPPMRLVYTFSGWTKTEAKVTATASWDGGSSFIATTRVPVGPDGAARLHALGAEYRLRRNPADPKGATLEVVGQPSVPAAWPF